MTTDWALLTVFSVLFGVVIILIVGRECLMLAVQVVMKVVRWWDERGK